jgi:hypothetical protein
LQESAILDSSMRRAQAGSADTNPLSTNSNMQRWRHMAGGIGVLAVLLSCEAGLPTDDELAAELRDQRGRFDALRDLALGDTMLSTVESSAYYARSGRRDTVASLALPAARWQRYRMLLGALHRDAVQIDSSGVRIPWSARGMVGSGSTKGFAYLVRPPHPSHVCASLDDPPPPALAKAHDECYRPVDLGWYLYLSW